MVCCISMSGGFPGASDWLDGFVARRYNQGSVIGSYLDPLADKVLICCTAAALAHEVFLYPHFPRYSMVAEKHLLYWNCHFFTLQWILNIYCRR